MRNSTSNALAKRLNIIPLKVAYVEFEAFDVTENQFFFVYNESVVQAYRVDGVWYCKY